MRLSDENIRGRTVIDSGGQAIGEVVGLFLETDARSIEAVQVKLRKDMADRLGVGRSVFRSGALEVPMALVQSVGDAVILSVAADELRRVLPPEHEPPAAH